MRIGHPARLLESVQKFCLDALVVGSEEFGKSQNEIRKSINKLNMKLKKAKTKNEKKDIYQEFKMLKSQLR